MLGVSGPQTNTVARAAIILAALAFVSACQTNSTETTSAIPVLESASDDSSPAVVSDETSAAEATDADTSTDAPPAETAAEPAETTPAQQVASVRQSEEERLTKAATDIAGLEASRGREAAFNSVLGCYERAQQQSSPVSLAKICATQDFVISRGRLDAGGGRDRLLIIAQRAPQRIGALMELKGMRQAEFNQFGLFLNRIALPAYKQSKS
ncbi:MAG: hypothetical protein AAGG69_04135 [Pseudomonadota bacterium]